ncbi:hypothetical protein [Zhongshania sp.]|jgi:hypothetical protein|uniref:hypothetical protein n=1 Tax=Zhongshania sp. TaxID=1971902 RepID=UPI002A7FAC93|nr:hypothetical protein [Zhongshania sp.]
MIAIIGKHFGKTMQLIASDTEKGLALMLDGYSDPAILVSADYQILARNERYRETSGEIDPGHAADCYEVSHG